MTDDAGWGGGEPTPTPAGPKTTEELIIELGHLNREMNNNLLRIRGYLGFLVLVTAINVALWVLWLTGAITISFTPSS